MTETKVDAELEYLGKLVQNSEELRKRCRMTSKVHYNSEEVYGWMNGLLGFGTVVGSLSANGTIPTTSPKIKSLTVVAASVCAGILTWLKPSAVAVLHHNAGVNYGNLERQARSWELRADKTIKNGAVVDVNALRLELDQLWERKADFDQSSPLAYEVVHWYTKWRLGSKVLDK